MNTKDFAPLKLFITGPTYLRDEVRQAGLLPEFGHRDSENKKRFESIFGNLKKLAQVGDGYQVVLFNGSGSSAMEASIRSLVADSETVLNVSVGAFGDLYHKMAVVNGKRAVQLKFEPGSAVDLAVLAKSLAEHKPQVVTCTHNETSTGVTNDIKAVCRLVREHGAMPLVDGVSIFGGAAVGIEAAGAAMYSTSTQKSLGLPAGFGIGFIAREALDKAKNVVKNRGFATDIVGQAASAEKFQTLTTPNCTLANQMCVQLDWIVNVEGIEARFARHLEMRDMAHAWVKAQDGLSLFAPEGHRSATLTAVKTPAGMTTARLKKAKEAMRAKGYLFDPGYGKLNTQLEEKGKEPLFRIGHMGDITPLMLEKFLSDLREVLKNA